MTSMWARRTLALALSAMMLFATLPASAFAFAPPKVGAPAATLTTENDVRLWSRKSTTKRAVASTIKMLNALVVRDYASLDETVTVTKKAAAINDGDVGLRTGQQLKVRQLLEIMMVASANDAAEALAIHIAGSEKAYVALMNAKAKQLGLTCTRATDPHGLSKKERSTAHDLAILARVVTADPVLAQIVKKKSVMVPRAGGKKAVKYRSTNHLLGVNGVKAYRGIEGVKTGYTRKAGFCLVSTATRYNSAGEKVRLVGVVMGAPRNNGAGGRFDQMRRLLDWGFKHTHYKTLASTESTLAVPVSDPTTTTVVVARPAWKVRTLLLDGTTITRTVLSETPVLLPPVPGKQVGLLKIAAAGKALRTVPLIATGEVSVPATTTPTPTQ